MNEATIASKHQNSWSIVAPSPHRSRMQRLRCLFVQKGVRTAMYLQASHFPQGQTVILPDHLTCPLCLGEYKVRGFYGHLKTCGPKHGLESRTAYEKAHPMTLYSPAHQFAAKWFSLARFSITRFGLMDYAGQRWCHIDAGNPKSWYRSRWSRKPETSPLVRFRDGRPLLKESFYQFKKHLQGELTLGIWPDMDNRFTIIDLDDEQVHHLPELLHRLKQMDLHHYVEFSGKKGYHIWIFWNEILSNRELIAFNDALCEGITQDRNIWPFKQSLVKLPLGLHRETSRLACFVNEINVPVPSTTQFTYFLSICNNTYPGPLPGHSVAVPAPSRSVQSKRARCKSSSSRNTKRTVEWKATEQECQDMLQKGYIKDGYCRERLLFRLASYMQDVRHLNQNECRQVLFKWSRKVSQRNLKELGYDVNRQVAAVYKGTVCFSLSVLPELTEDQKKKIGVCIYDLLRTPHRVQKTKKRSFKRQKEQATASMTLIAEYLTRLILANKGRCHVSFTTIAQRTGLNRKRVQKWLPVLCGEPWSDSLKDHQGLRLHEVQYRGTMFMRQRAASYGKNEAQEYVFSERFAEDLGFIECMESVT